jgi:nitric oxide reductase NorD protein
VKRRDWFGARRAALKARFVLQSARARVRARFARRPATVALDSVQRRLELVLTAAYGRPITIAPIEARGWRHSLARVSDNGWVSEQPTIDGETIRLPPALATHGDAKRAVDRYRLLAIEQAERLTRGTPALAPHADALERDLYLLREGAAIDAHIARTYPGMAEVLEAERAAALARRPKVEGLTATERDVEQMVRDALSREAPRGDGDEPGAQDPAASLAWAQATARQLRQRGDRYRGIPLASAWGAAPQPTDTPPQLPQLTYNFLQLQKSENATEGEPSDQPNDARDASPDEPRPAREKPRTATKEYDVTVQTEEDTTPVPDAAPSDDPNGTQSLGDSRTEAFDPRLAPDERLPPAIYYDEWDGDHSRYARGAAAVRLYDAVGADPTSLEQEMRDRAATVRLIRQQFERLRARRTLLMRQQRGDALDLAACVDAAIDRRLGDSPDDRVYVDARPARRGLAIALVIDVSGSTDQRVSETARIIDIEKIALVMATQALDALGDLYAIYAFAGRHSSNVKVTVVKDFPERNGRAITRRIAALTPGGFTRLGAAVRHATRQLSKQSAGHRLLLLLSDGRPNDLDMYQGAYGVEDSRQAILEARASGVFPYCLTIDQAASEYLPHIFGTSGHTVLQKPEQLPRALLNVVRGLIRR